MGKNIPGIHQKCLFLLCHPRGCKSRKKSPASCHIRRQWQNAAYSLLCFLPLTPGCKVIYLTDAVAGLSEVSRKETENIISYFAPLHTVLMTTEEYLLSDTPKSHLCYKVSGHKIRI